MLLLCLSLNLVSAEKFCVLKSPEDCHGRWREMVAVVGVDNPFNGVRLDDNISATKSDPSNPSHSRSILDRIPLERSTQVPGPCNDVLNMHQNVSYPPLADSKQRKFDAMKIGMSVIILALFTYLLANVYITNHVHRQVALVNRDRVKNTGINTTANVVIHYTMYLNDVIMDEHVMNDDILASVATLLKFKSLQVTESSAEQKKTNFDLDKFLAAETTAVDGERKISTESTGAKAVSSDLFLVF